MMSPSIIFFFFNDTATTEIYTLSLHDALPIFRGRLPCRDVDPRHGRAADLHLDRKSTRLNSSHVRISYAVFCLKKKIERGEIGEHHLHQTPAQTHQPLGTADIAVAHVSTVLSE